MNLYLDEWLATVVAVVAALAFIVLCLIMMEA